MDLLVTGKNNYHNDDCLFDLDLLNQMCDGLDDTTCAHLESHQNIVGNYDESSDALKSELDQMWCELNESFLQYRGHKYNKNKTTNETKRFPRQLRTVLDDPQYSSVTSWQCDGRSFAIHDQEAFQAEILPLFFKTARWKSFQKQLNIYGFQNVKGERRVYYHKQFIRDKPSLTTLMKRERVWPKSK